jgi:hypothetical protein
MRRGLALAGVVTVVACAMVRADGPPARLLATTAAAASQSTAAPWRSFSGRLTASGRMETVLHEDGGVASTVRLTGTLVIVDGDGLSRGFQVDALGFDDGSGAGIGRAVWTDDRGDRLFSRLTGVATQSGRRSEGTFTGGTGRYAGLTGTYAFTWQYVMPGEPGVIQARATSVSGRVRWDPRR